MKGRWNFSSTFSKQIVLPTKSWNYQGPWSKSAQPKVRWAPNLRGVVCWPLRYPQAERHESQGSGIPEQLPPNLGEKQDPFAHFVLLPTYHVASMWRRRSDRNCWFCSFCRFCCARVGGQKLQKQLILGSWRYRSYWSSLSGICDFCSSRVGGQNPQNPLKKKRVPRWVHFWSYQIFQQFLCNLPPYPGTAESTETAIEIKNFKVVSVP